MNRTTRIVIPIILFLIGASWAPARYVLPDLVRVPLARLTANLAKKIGKDPKNPQYWYELARVYSMAYVIKSEDLNTRLGKDGEPDVYYGLGPSAELPPSGGEPVDLKAHFKRLAEGEGDKPDDVAPEPEDPERLERAKEHLAKAIEYYEKAIKLGKDDGFVRLGLGWCLQESKENERAKEHYRKAVEMGWKKEKWLDSIFDISVTEEAAGYLKPLLDPEKDAQELADLEQKIGAIKGKQRMVTPILVPLHSGLPFESLVAPDARVKFDLDGSGVEREWGWITRDAAWLVFIGAGNEPVESGVQMFGAFTFMISRPTGYDALASLDNDDDGEIRGEELRGIGLWRDSNSNGVCEPGEALPLSAYGIAALSCRHEPHSSGIPFNPAGCILEDGTVRATYDWMAPSVPIEAVK